jgi:hypothetical protein
MRRPIRKGECGPGRDRIEDIHCFLDNEELTRERIVANCEVSGLPKAADAMDKEKCASGAANAYSGA